RVEHDGRRRKRAKVPIGTLTYEQDTRVCAERSATAVRELRVRLASRPANERLALPIQAAARAVETSRHHFRAQDSRADLSGPRVSEPRRHLGLDAIGLRLGHVAIAVATGACVAGIVDHVAEALR